MSNIIKLYIFSYQRYNSAKLSREPFLVIILSVCISMFTGCGKQDTILEPNPRPVTVLELRELNPVKPLQLTGSVMSWKEQDISFEVSGRVEWIVEMGTNLEGRWEEDGKVHIPGDVMASIDKRHYKIRLKAAWLSRNVHRPNT